MELVRWMTAMNLDLVNTGRLEKIDPVEMMVRGSLDLGVEVIISIRLYDRWFYRRKRVIQRTGGAFFSKYTEGIYTGSDTIECYPHSTIIIKKLFEDKYVGKAGLKYLVAWSIYRQFFEFTVPYFFRGGRKADESCFVHVKNVMNLAILSHHFQTLVTPGMIGEVRHMAFRIKNTFWEALNSSSWLTSTFRTRFLTKLDLVKFQVGSPEDRLDPESIETFYERLPDVPFNRLFPSWIQGRRLNTHYRWKDQRTRFYDEEAVNAFYMWKSTVVIPTAIVHDPLFYEYEPVALNYGGLGMVLEVAQQQREATSKHKMSSRSFRGDEAMPVGSEGSERLKQLRQPGINGED
ncbi:hypothetical protein MRX96_049506 [Rhipicephalus microplus]